MNAGWEWVQRFTADVCRYVDIPTVKVVVDDGIKFVAAFDGEKIIVHPCIFEFDYQFVKAIVIHEVMHAYFRKYHPEVADHHSSNEFNQKVFEAYAYFNIPPDIAIAAIAINTRIKKGIINKIIEWMKIAWKIVFC